MLSQSTDDEWIRVFRQRGVWNLTRSAAEEWVAQNEKFFRILQEKISVNDEILELGCGPGRHVIGAAMVGLTPTGIDHNLMVIEQARRNSEACGVTDRVSFQVGDMNHLEKFARDRFSAVTHGGLMEHFPSEESVRESLRKQLEIAPLIVFDVPAGTEKNLALFARDDIFRQEWTPEIWLEHVLAPFHVDQWHLETHDPPSMTDDLVVVLCR